MATASRGAGARHFHHRQRVSDDTGSGAAPALVDVHAQQALVRKALQATRWGKRPFRSNSAAIGATFLRRVVASSSADQLLGFGELKVHGLPITRDYSGSASAVPAR